MNTASISTTFALLLVSTAALANPAPSIRIARAATPPPIGGHAGRLPGDERGHLTDFRQRDPNDGEPATLETTADVTYDNERLYVTFVCRADPAQVRAHLSRREDIRSDDLVAVWLDTFHDGRHAYVFYVNPLGVQLDGLVTEGQSDDFSFDAVWDSTGHLTETGYVVRLAIPFRSLRYRDEAVSTWGIALGRSIPSRAELSTWPHLTSKVDAFVPQFASLEGLEHLPHDHLVDITPYMSGAAERFLDPSSGMRSGIGTDRRAGLDAKVVVARDWTIDATVHPDFSQVESDEPQVTANQRYEVYFPEKRPFFTDRAGFFQTPDRLFFSRRIVDPIAGVRLTGVTGGWTVGTLVVDDGAMKIGGDRSESVAAIARVQRAFRRDSYWGATASFLQAPSGFANRILSLDTRTKLTPNWIVTAQVVDSATADRSGARPGLALFGELRHAGRHLNYYSNYRDRSPEFSAPLGFITRVDMRQMKHVVGYRWRPTHGALVGIGPSVFALANWNHASQLQDASIDLPLWLDFKGPASVAVGRTQATERYRGEIFHRDSTYVYASSEALGWLSVDGSISHGRGINYYPATGTPSSGAAFDASLGVGVRPSARLQVSESFVLSRLSRDGAALFTDRYLRVKSSLQITRAWSVRAIAEAHRLDVDGRYADVPESRLTLDLLGTYMLHPGSAVYFGFTDRYEDLSLDPDTPLPQRPSQRTLVARQLFVKITRTLSF